MKKVRNSIQFLSQHLLAPVLTFPTSPNSHDHEVDDRAPMQAKPSTCTLGPIHQQSLSLDISKTVYLSFSSELVSLSIFPGLVNVNSISLGILAKNLRVIPDSSLNMSKSNMSTNTLSFMFKIYLFLNYSLPPLLPTSLP